MPTRRSMEQVLEDSSDRPLDAREERLAQLPGFASTPQDLKRERAAEMRRKARVKS